VWEQLRWSYGVKLLSQADDETPDISTEQITQEALTAEPVAEPVGVVEATETDPLFDSRKHSQMVEDREEQALRARKSKMSQSVDEGTLAWTSPDAPSGGVALVSSPPAITSPSTETPFFQGAGSVPPLAAGATRRLSAMRRGSTASGSRGSTPLGRGRRTSNSGVSSSHQHHSVRPRAPSRTESGREFWGLPEARTSVGSLSDQEEEGEGSSSDDEEDEDEEWVSGPAFPCALPLLTGSSWTWSRAHHSPLRATDNSPPLRPPVSAHSLVEHDTGCTSLLASLINS
jgi:hypothetical protein